MEKKESFIVNRLKSVGYAFKGMLMLIRTESSIQIQVFIAIAVTIAGFYFDISRTEWMIQITMIGLVMSIEGINIFTKGQIDAKKLCHSLCHQHHRYCRR